MPGETDPRRQLDRLAAIATRIGTRMEEYERGPAQAVASALLAAPSL